MKQNVLSVSGHQVRVFPRWDSEANLAMRGKMMKLKLDFEESAAHRHYYRVILHMTYNSNLNQGQDQAL